VRRVLPIARSVAALLPLIFFFGAPASGMDASRSIRQYVQESWNVRDGLPQNVIEAMLQTRDRHLWLGFRGDLVRFDGLQFKSAQEIVNGSLAGFEIVTLYEDRNGDIWAGSYGSGLLRLHDGNRTVFNRDDGLPSDVVWAIQEDSKGTLWVGTENGGLAWFENGRFRKFDQIGATDEIISSILPDKDGGLWIGSHYSGLLHLKDHQLQSYPTSSGNSVDAILSMALDQDGSIWIGTEDGKLLNFKDNRFLSPNVSMDFLKGVQIQSLLVDRDRILWIGTFGSGLGRLGNGKLTMLTQANGLPDNVVWDLLEDDEGNVWVATRAGLFQLRDGNFTTFDKQEGLSDDSVWALTQSTDGSIWIGTDKGVNRFQHGAFSVPTSANGLPGNAIWSLASDPAGNVWIGTSSSGIARFANGKILQLTEKEGLPGNSVRALLVDRAGRLYVGTHGSGLARFENGRFQNFSKKEGLSDNFVRTLLEDSEGNIWIGTDHGGVDRLQNGSFKNYSTRSGLKTNAINCLYEDSRKDLWIGTDEGGLSRLHEGKIDSITSSSGLYSDEIFSIVEDHSSNLWMGCDRAVFMVSIKNLEDFFSGKIKHIRSQIFDTSDGLKRSEGSNGQPAALRSIDGKLWFATIGGVAMIDPRRPRKSSRIPVAQIEEILVDGKVYLHSDQHKIPPGFHRIDISYSAISFSKSRNLRFRYRLDGLSPEWGHPVQERVAGFSSLPAGDYEFIVEAGVGDEWGAASTIRFSVQPFFYQTTWFYLTAVLALVGAVLLVIRVRTRSLVRSRLQLESLVRQRTSDLEASNQRISREVMERQRAEMITKSTLEARQALIEAIPDTILEVNREGNLLLVVPGSVLIPAEAQGKPLSEVLSTEAADIFMTQIRASVDLQENRSFEHHYVDERFALDIEVRLAPLSSSAVVVVRDITETKAVERLKNQFVSIVSHELRSPLTAIRASLGLIHGEVVGEVPTKVKELTQLSLESTERLSHLLDDLLDIEKMQAGKMRFTMNVCSLETLLRKAISQNELLVTGRGASIRQEQVVPGVSIRVDEYRFIQILTNLISNAAKFSPPGGVVRIRAEKANRTVRIQVSDEGPGVPVEFRPRLFKQFSQADGEDSRKYTGAGLGLSISKKLVEMMGGSIGYEERVSGGAIFYIDLPVVEMP